MLRLLLLISMLATVLPAYDIDEILDLYRKENDLSKRTKDEAMGHVDVYTRDDLERMQARRLSDLFRSIKLLRYDENTLGMVDPLHADPMTYMSDSVKVYINDQELTSAFIGSAVFIYGNIDLGFVDHVEVYYGLSSVEVSTEFSAVSIKLYSKTAERDSGSKVGAFAGSRGHAHAYAMHSESFENYSYFAYASATNMDREEHSHNGHTIARDFEEMHAFANFKTDNHVLDLELLKRRHDGFLALSMLATPNPSEIEYLFGRVALTSQFLDDRSLQLRLSASRMVQDLELNTLGTRWTTDFFNMNVDQNESLVIDSSLDDIVDVKLSKEYQLGSHTVIGGVEWRYKHLDDNPVTLNGLPYEQETASRIKITSAYLQDEYSFSDSHMLALSGRFSYYDYDSFGQIGSFDTTLLRAGYIHAAGPAMFKVFLAYAEVPTELYALTTVPNADLKIVKVNSITAEAERHFDKLRLALFAQKTRTDTAVDIMNLAELDSNAVTLNVDYAFDAFNSIKTQYYYFKMTDLLSGDDNHIYGFNGRLLNSWGNWDLFNELTYYHLKGSGINGMEYTAALRYKVTPDLTLNLKGVNLFDSAAESQYRYLQFNGIIPSLESLYISPIDRLITVGMEYTF